MAAPEKLGAQEQILRFVSLKFIENGRPSPDAFALRPQDKGVSVNWLGAFGQDHGRSLDEIRRLRRREVRQSSRLAEMNVGDVMSAGSRFPHELSVILDPLRAEVIMENRYEADPSHALIMGLLRGDTEEAMKLRAAISSCVTEMHPALAV